MKLINVIPIVKIPLPLPQILGYFSSAKNLKIGGLVSVPLGKRKVPGLIVEQKSIEEEKINIKMAGYQLRPINKIINPNPAISKQQLELALWMHEYYYEPLGIILKSMLFESIDLISNFQFPISKQILNSKSQTPKLLQLDIKSSISYFNEEIKKTLKEKRQILILAPEINILNYLQKNIFRAIPCIVPRDSATITSRMSPKQFREIWQKTAEGKIKIIFGTRKALFLPFRDLGLIILAEEHNANYKSRDQHPKYHSRETAVKLTELFGAKLIMQSGIPSIESKYQISNIKNQKCFKFLPPQTEQANSHTQISPKSPNPKYEIIDMRQEIKMGNYSIFSNGLLDEIKKAVEKKEKIILFINRLGHSTMVLCRDCGHIIKCKNCEVSLALHETYSPKPVTHNLVCHHCNYREPAPTLCPKCNGHRIKLLGAGTQKVELELKKILPDVKILRLDSDVAKTKEEKQFIVDQFINGHERITPAILIGTQLINTVPLPQIDLIGIVNIETMLNLPDFRGGERTFQTIYGLLNKLKKSGIVICQSYSPDHYAIENGLNRDYEKFYKEELYIRKLFNYPPFSQIVKLAFSHKNKGVAEREAKRLYEKLSTINCKLSTIIGPAPAFIPRKKNRYIWNIIIKDNSPKIEIRNQLLRLAPSSWSIDADPESLL